MSSNQCVYGLQCESDENCSRCSKLDAAQLTGLIPLLLLNKKEESIKEKNNYNKLEKDIQILKCNFEYYARLEKDRQNRKEIKKKYKLLIKENKAQEKELRKQMKEELWPYTEYSDYCSFL